MIYGIGLPRTGTSTLAEALRLLGLKGSSYCVLHNKGRLDKGVDFIVDNTIYNRLDTLIDDTSLYILTTREINHWASSISKFSGPESMPTVIEYRTYVDSYINPKRLLTVDWTKGDGWDELCGFLDLPQPDYAFPCINC